MQRIRQRLSRQRTAFTLIEVLVVIAIVVVLAALLLPALGNAKQSSYSISCLNNIRQLETCLNLFLHDNDDAFPSNNYVYFGSPSGPVYQVKDVSWAPGDAMTDLDTTQLQQGSLFPYNNSPAIYHCPSDRSLAKDPLTGNTAMRTRSYKLNIWLNSTLVEPAGCRVLSDLMEKPDSGVFAFIDSHEENLQDPPFGIKQASDLIYANRWMDLPAYRHNRGANVSFLDGHAERWQWRAAKIFQHPGQGVASPADKADLRRLQDALPPPRK